MPGLARQLVAVPGRAGGGVALAAGGNDDCVRQNLFPVFGQRAAHCLAVIGLLEQQLLDAAVVEKTAAAVLGLLHQRIDNVGGVVGDGEDPLAALHL